MSEVKKKELTPEVAAKYTVLPGIGVGEVAFKGKTIHLDKLNVAQAEKLVEAGMNVLVSRKPADPKKP